MRGSAVLFALFARCWTAWTYKWDYDIFLKSQLMSTARSYRPDFSMTITVFLQLPLMRSGALPSLETATVHTHAPLALQSLPSCFRSHSTSLHRSRPGSIPNIRLRALPKNRLHPPNNRQHGPPRKPRRPPNTKHNPNRQQHLRNRIRGRKLNQHPRTPLPKIPNMIPPPQFHLGLRLNHVLAANPPLALEVLAELLDGREHPRALGEPGRQPLRVVECSGEPEEGDDGGEFVQNEEGGDVGERGVGERGGVSVQEFGEAAVEAVDARGGGGWWCWLGCEAARAEGGGA